ncbi:MAG: hypothetical protein AAFU50_10185 [Pseudomonadota bacterium]
MKTLLIAFGASVAMSGAAFAMDGCMGSKAYTADAGKSVKPEASQTAKASTPAPAPVAGPEKKTAEKVKPEAETKTPS